MSVESDHKDPVFQEKKYIFFRDFMLKHLPEAREFKRNGLFVEEGSKRWRNLLRHLDLSGVMAETISELLGRSAEETKQTTHDSLMHDADKRRQHESMTAHQVIIDESRKNKRPFVATSSNFTGFNGWGLDEYILRYVDSSIGENSKNSQAGQWYGARDKNNLPEVLILPWRRRLQMFRESKAEEGERGIPVYGMTTWDKLEEIMESIENSLFKSIIEKNPGLSGRFNDSSQLTELIEERIHKKIMNS